ncbi:IgGFc-binding protein [Gadus chalcogrammus]|uniref:IgGFc-binding protein n=1 Tax=Gadus chalcogrammus TaxID=1042646 RepID=UPI0024C4DFC7|nr:IgGFc-binding protein [Gadus chalcogrammus]XP_056457900.1 IgGFc-binding protein [Gadus chalcogrammus]
MDKLLLFCCLALLHSSSASVGFAGKEFAFSFMQNHKPNYKDTHFSITIIAQQPTKVKVHVPSLDFLKEEFLKADQSVIVRLPDKIELIGSKKYTKTVLVEATADVMVTSFNYKKVTADSALLYPISEWGTEYYVFTPSGTPSGESKEFSVTNGKQNNSVEIDIKGGLLYQGHLYADGQRLVLDLGPYESLQLQSSHDLTGSRISSQYPVGVMSGHTCNWLFAKCDHVYEQLLPVRSWGSNFMVAPLMFQRKYDSIFIQASQYTNVNIQNGEINTDKTLSIGQFMEVRYHFPDAVTIKADHGVQVLMLFNGAKLHNHRIYDNFLLTILPTEILCSSYSLVTQKGFDNIALILAPKAKKQEITIDGNSLIGVTWHDMPGTDFSFSQVAIRPEPVRIFSSSGFSFGLYGLGVTRKTSFASTAICRKPVVKPGICWAQGDPHYSTFDGRRFDFMGTCTYVVAKNCEKNTDLPSFEISAQNENRGNTRVSYIGLVTVKIAGYTITTVRSEIGRVRVDNNLWSLPLTLNEGKLQLFQGGRSILIQTDFGLLVRYDWISLLVVSLPPSFAGKTCGLCGNFNGDPKDDLTTSEGTQAAGVLAFGASWKVPGLVKDDRCTDDCVGGCKSCTSQQMKQWEVDSSCGLMALVKKGPFSKCHAAVDPVPYMDNCKFDLCMNNGLKHFLCKSLESYAESCQEADSHVDDWRKLAKCPYKCQSNSVYQQCGSACPATCSNPNPICNLPCMETCTCNKGFVLIDGECQPVENCGCTHEGRYLAPGQSYWADDKCQKRCTCNANTRKVECEAVGCKTGTLCRVLKGIKDCHPISHGKCRATGDPHYVTFDKKKFDFMGTCVYQMVKHSMGTDLVPFEVLVQNDHRGSNVVSYTKMVEVKVYSLSVVISRTYQGVVMVDGELANLPLSLAGNRVSVYKSGRYAVVSTNFGLKVIFDWERALFVSVPSSYMGQVSGLCGNYNGKAEDDLTPKDGMAIVPQAEFGASWQVENIPGCVDSCKGKCPNCDITQKRRYETGTFCGILTDPKGPFRDCHSKVNPADYFEDCVFDVCSFEGRKKVLCEAIASYSSACQAGGAKVYRWRTSQFCEFKCPANSRYETCAAVCPATCQTNLASLGCDEPCREGCVCEEGFVLSGERCVPVSQCGCVDGDRYYTLNQVFYPNGKCDKECKCNADGEVECKTFACGANEVCQLEKGKRQCRAVGVGICQRSGDLHYRSFDGRVFNLQGTCTYTLSKTNLMKGTHLVPYTVLAENYNQKSSVTKGVTLDVYGFNLVLRNTVSGVLVNGVLHYLPLSLNNGAVNVYQKGVHYFMATDFGLLLSYDLNYFLTLTVPGNYKGQTSGLCGNFNDNPKDDLQQPDGSLTADLNVFTGSWEVHFPGIKCERGCIGHNCMANDKTDKCPDAMSSQVCLPLINGNAFKQCRAKVDPRVFDDNCVADSCTSKGDPKVVCDNMAAYALRCHLSGIKVNWRTDKLCPMKCPANSHYEVCSNNCGVACPGLTDVVECTNSCTEGCTCNDGFLFNGQSCVPMTQCGCYENGKTFRPNEVVYGEGCMQSCKCDPVNGLVCKAHSCPAESECQVKKGVRACFHQDPCASRPCSTQEKCVVEDGQAVCLPMPTGTCWAWGDPHYRTFDGYTFEFQGPCRYIYSRTCGNLHGLAAFSINERNGGRANSKAASVKEVVVTVHGIKISAGRNKSSEVKVNEEPVTVPIVLGNGQVTISYKNGSPLIETDFGLQVWFECNWKVVVLLPRTYEGKVCGLCGNFNGKSNDELQNPAGQAISTVQEWSKSWRIDEPGDDPCLLD